LKNQIPQQVSDEFDILSAKFSQIVIDWMTEKQASLNLEISCAIVLGSLSAIMTRFHATAIHKGVQPEDLSDVFEMYKSEVLNNLKLLKSQADEPGEARTFFGHPLI
jgi:hypothetical protein